MRDYGRVARSYTKISKSRNKRGVEAQLIARGSQLPKELDAAKKKVESEAGRYSCRSTKSAVGRMHTAQSFDQANRF